MKGYYMMQIFTVRIKNDYKCIEAVQELGIPLFNVDGTKREPMDLFLNVCRTLQMVFRKVKENEVGNNQHKQLLISSAQRIVGLKYSNLFLQMFVMEGFSDERY